MRIKRTVSQIIIPIIVIIIRSKIINVENGIYKFYFVSIYMYKGSIKSIQSKIL